ncbi:flavin monoamine oxidase family protein [Candidatus Entotheonella palauensis]|uniref:flavin monoamine oxidase family protein n=1 Tax=Candidatus Entotheonella palauensis TaxID=93172 RepID=UPI0004BC204E|nr:NAD(P)/FAD-dependent oxidoreductase [Candidatus Entotheonella palauensis]
MLEARDRVGGRTYAKQLGEGIFDMGGQFVGAKQHRIHALAKEFDLELMRVQQVEEGKKIQDFNGVQSTFTTAVPLLSFWKPFPLVNLAGLGLTVLCLERSRKQIPADRPWDARKALKWDRRTVSGWLRDAWWRPRQVSGMFDAVVHGMFGANASEDSLLNFLHFLQTTDGFQEVAEGQRFRFANGSQQMSLKMAEGLGERVILEAPVHEIAQDNDGVTVHSGKGAWRGRYVVISVPLPLVNRIHFSPELPPERQLLAQRSYMGSIVKCLTLYDRPFWRDAGFVGEVLSDREPIAAVFDNSHPDSGQACLLSFIAGKHAYYWNKYPEKERRDSVLKLLEGWFGPEAGKPTLYHEYNWGEQAWTQGCPIANFSTGNISLLGKEYGPPLGRIHWASSELSHEWISYMEGGLASGENTAKEILAIA